MTGLGLPPEDFRMVTLVLDLPTAERLADAARRDGFGDDLARWLRNLADKQTG